MKISGVLLILMVMTLDVLAQSGLPPTIASFSPTSGPIGASVTITGTNFSSTTANNIVYFGTALASVTAATTAQITVTVPSGATYQPITVTVNGLTAYSNAPFIVTFPGVAAIDPSSFGAKVDFVSGTGPYGITTGDMDGDGKLDLIVPNYTSNTVSVFRNTSTTGSISSGSFSAKVDFTTGTNPSYVTIGDLDGDGKLDMAVPNTGSNTVSIFRNTSTSGSITSGSFAAKVDFATGLNSYAMAIGDVDGDGKPDLVIPNAGSNTVSVFRNTSTLGSITTGSFAAKVDFATGSNPISVAIDDLDGDGKPDLTIANSISSSVSIFRNTSTAGSITSSSLAAKVDLSAGSNSVGVAIGDVDRDGKHDLVVANSNSNTVSVFRNIGTSGTITAGSFAAKVDFATGSYPYTVTMGDLDGDGKLDIVVPNGNTTTISVIKNTSTAGAITSGSFAAKVDFTSGTQPQSVAIGDLDGDGKPDMAIINGISTTVSILRNVIGSSGTPTISSFAPLSGTIGTSITITGTNFSGTSVNNIVNFGAVRATVSAATTTQLTVTVPTGATYQPITVTVGGLTAYSGKPFLVTFSGGGTIDASSFAAKVDSGTGAFPDYTAIQDMDGDGKSDLLVVNGNGNTLSILRNTSPSGAISFATTVDFSTGTSPNHVASGDLDGDGKQDVVVPNASSNTVSVYRNTSTSGSITMTAQTNLTGTSPRYAAIGDLDLDGKPDIVITNYTANTISIFKNTSTTGTITFGAAFTFTTGTNPYGVALGDIDEDGMPDIIVVNQGSNTISVFRNTGAAGSISFATKVDFATPTGPQNVAVGDLDADGKLDMAVANSSGNTSVFKNTASAGSITTGSFATKVDLITAANSLGVSITDMDGDGKPDLAVVANSTNAVSVLKNNGPGAFAAKVDFGTGNGPGYSVSLGDLDGDGKPDMVVPNTLSNTASVYRNNIAGSASAVPAITSFTPTSGAVGTSVTIIGANFSTTSTNNIVYFGAVKAAVNSATATQLTVTVPTGVTYQPITLTVGGLTAYSSKPFVVTFSGGGTIDATSFASKVDFATGTNPQTGAVGDMDGDGKPDLVVQNYTSNTISVFRNASALGSITSASFAAKVDFLTGTGPNNVAVGDVDGDGKLDFVVANNASNTVSVFKNTSTLGSITTGSFATKVDFTTGTGPRNVAIRDVDRDGKPDLVVTNYNSSTVSVFQNTSTSGSITTSSFATKVDFATGPSPYGIAIGDLDGDGKQDLVVTNYGATGGGSTISVFQNTSTSGSITSGSFATKIDLTTGAGPFDIAMGDMDGDGKPDLVIANLTGATVSVLKNTSISGTITTGSFAAKVDFTTGTSPYSVALGDLDGDGKTEVVVPLLNSNAVSVFRNISTTGSFTSGSLASSIDFTTATGPDGVAIGDLDGDGKPDLAIANYTSGTVSVLRNQIAAAAAPTITSVSPQSGAVGTSVTITGTNFSTIPANNTVKFNSTTATVTASTATSISTSVPSGATTGAVTVTVGGQIVTGSNFTVTTSALTITAENFISTYLKDGTSKVSITVSDVALVSSVKFWAKGITVLNTYTSRALTASGNKFEAVFTTAELSDPIGLLYYFEVLDNSLNSIPSKTGTAYLGSTAGATEQSIPSLSFGDQVSNYQIISVPSLLTDKTVGTAFKALGSYDKAKWRLFTYTNGALVEYPSFNTIEPGKGYWFISKASPSSTGINVGAGTTIQVTESTPFVLNLIAGWNLIGNPYNFRVSWQDVLTFNASTSGINGVGALRVFSAGSLTNGSALEKFRGAFVNSASAIALKIPVIRTLTGRVNEEKGIQNSIDQSRWEVNFILSNGMLSNHLGGIGMHPQAKLTGVDPFDEVGFSLLDDFGMVSLAFMNVGSSITLDKDIVPTAGSYTWNVNINRGKSETPIILSWSNDYYGDNDKKLVLFDPTTLQVVDMRRQNQYTLSRQTNKLRILFGTQDYINESLDKELPLVGWAYPNPAQQRVVVPFRVPLSVERAAVNISVYDSQGKVITTLVNGEYQKGNYEGVWNPEVTPGLYLIQFKLGTNRPEFQKIVIR